MYYRDQPGQNRYFGDQEEIADVYSPAGGMDRGPDPMVVNLEQAVLRNNTFRTALWTGEHLQLTLMKINVRDEIGLEIHPDHDQLIGIVQGTALVLIGDSRDWMKMRKSARRGDAILIPAGKWHNVVNTGRIPLKVFSVYAPPIHPHGTVQMTKQDADMYH